MLRLLSKHFRKPEGLFGKFIANRMVKMNYNAYHALDRHANLEKGMNIFEIGYGPGYGIEYFLDNYDITYHGIDYSELMYANAKKRLDSNYSDNRGKLHFGDFLEYNHCDESMDRVLFSNVTYFWKDLNIPFKNIYSMLKDDGKLILYMSDKKLLEKRSMTNNRNFNLHDKRDVVKILSQCGFRDIVETRLYEDNPHRIIIEAVK